MPRLALITTHTRFGDADETSCCAPMTAITLGKSWYDVPGVGLWTDRRRDCVSVHIKKLRDVSEGSVLMLALIILPQQQQNPDAVIQARRRSQTQSQGEGSLRACIVNRSDLQCDARCTRAGCLPI